MSAAGFRFRNPSALPGFGLSLGFTVFYLSVIVLIPIAALIVRPWEIGFSGFWNVISDPRVLAALRLSFGGAAIAAVINAVTGPIVAWVLVRYNFPGKRLLDALIDLPFALPTAVAGIALSQLYSANGWVGEPLSHLGIRIAYTPIGVIIALTFIGLPFVVRTLQPVLNDLSRDPEEAAATLGANRWQTITRVVLPSLMPALLTGATLAFARAVGEYGSVIFIAGNLPTVSEIAPLLIVIKLEQYDYAGAAAIGVVMLAASFAVILALNLLQNWIGKRR
ncbi:sulfate ABC transporter permease subunit CysT [Rhizomicrobium electricum]|jgi:sulfate transport system permease protein|uniref:Sulfate transport system permease protein CysT n=1 Tax=Rhizomicrobium electricum TaxID=480070 RepID=A0ABN1E7K5_9PROT|nr:sulfate ABC transporter permease subunit CysT [Rhizomicrobium electricum]NIJ47805.1 sulfate transport system permease protein [Rhizomicrobium electricum]